MARRDHDPGRRAQAPDRERQQRGRLLPRDQVDPDPGPGQHLGGLVAELIGAVPRVAADDHARLRALAGGGFPAAQPRRPPSASPSTPGRIAASSAPIRAAADFPGAATSAWSGGWPGIPAARLLTSEIASTSAPR